MTATPRRTALRIDDPAEDVPRLITGGGRACGGEWGLVLRPTEARGMLILAGKEGVWAWKADGAGDAVAMPRAAMELAAAVSALKDARKGIGRKPGPITLRGRWKGSITCGEDGPRLVLERKVAPYARLQVEASPEAAGWAWTLDREARWFTGAGTTAGSASTLREAVEQAALALEGIVGEACTTRDTRRRGAYDADYTGKAGASAPVGPGRRGRDVVEWAPKAPRARSTGWTHVLHDDDAPEVEEIERPTQAHLRSLAGAGLVHDREAGTLFGRTTAEWDGHPAGTLVFREAHDNGFHLGPVSKARGRRKAPVPPPVDAPVRLLDPPATPAAMQRLEQEVTAEADALAGLRSRRWVWEDSDVAAEVQQWFAENGLDHEAGEVASFVRKPWDGATSLADLRRGLESEVPALRRDALAQVDRLEAWWVEAPQLVARARNLIRYAARMVESPLCRGREKQEAAAALDRAVLAYDAVPDAIAAGREVDGVMELRRIGERVAVSAAKSARSCARGQRSLTATAASPVAAGGWKAGDRFAVEGGREGTVLAVPSEGARRVEVEWDTPVELGPGESVRRQKLRVDTMLDADTGRRRGVPMAPPVRAAEPPSRVDRTTVPGLTIVPVGVEPRTADELRALTAGHAQAFAADPKASTAKKWVKSALLHLGLEAVNVSAKSRSFEDLGGGRRVFVTLVMPGKAEGEATDAKLRLLSRATPRGLSVEDWDYAPSGANRSSRPAPAPAAPGEGEVDAAKDKALLDAFSAAIAAAMREAG